MTSINKSSLVLYTPAEMFALVSDIDSYQDFLPWCSDSRVLERGHDEMKATVEIKKGSLHRAFTTHNRHQKDKMIEIRLLDGPFKRLEGYWRFDPLGDGEACKVSLDLEFEFSNRMIGMVVGPIFSQIANTLVDAFHERAVQVYGKR
jgi:ribosome-associated toxin RatA of RatAB toxin-antitoxin module